MADLDDLKATKSLAITNLKTALTSPKPTYSVDGQRVEWTEYTDMLRRQISGLNELIAAEEFDVEQTQLFPGMVE